MTVPTHRLPVVVFTALAGGGGGVEAIRRLHAARHSMTRLAVHTLTALSKAAGHPEAATVERAYLALQHLDRTAAQPMATILCYPPVSAWAIETSRQLRGTYAHRTHPGFLAAVAAAVAIRAGVALQLEVPLPRRRDRCLVLPSLGWARVPATADQVLVRCADGRAELVHAGRPFATVDPGDRRWRPIPRVQVESGGLRLAVSLDGTTWRQATGTPLCEALDIVDNDVDATLWQERLAEAWRLLVRQHQCVAEEIAAGVTVLAPLASPATGMVSGTFHSAFGAVAMSTPVEPRLVALTLAHEVQHTKLATLMDLFPLITGGGRERYYAPWRNDSRPLHGLLNGAYAHLGVAGFWRRQRHGETDRRARRRAEVEFSRWTSVTYEVTQVLRAQPRLTMAGRRLVSTMADVLDTWRQEPVSDEAARAARRLTQAHLSEWRKNHISSPVARPES